MRALRTSVAVAIAVVSTAAPAWAATITANASVQAVVPDSTAFTLEKDAATSVPRFAADQIVFDRVDNQDPGVTGPSPDFMYAPYRSETGMNWHIGRINATGSSMTLSADVTGTAGSTPLANILSTFCGGFFPANGPPGVAIPGTPSTDWENLNTFTRTLNQSFSGVTSFNYRLSIAGIPAGTYNGQVTYTMVSN